MTNPSRYRADLPTIPGRMLTLPLARGFPVPWFVADVDGQYDFRVIGPGKLAQAVRERRCWVCGQPLGGYLACVIGSMCALNRTISEPPSHRDCATFSALACPFLTQREAQRRTTGLPEDLRAAPGLGLPRQPGVVCLWTTRQYRPFRVPPQALAAAGAQPGVLFALGEPTDLRWYREGRAATPAEIYAAAVVFVGRSDGDPGGPARSAPHAASGRGCLPARPGAVPVCSLALWCRMTGRWAHVGRQVAGLS